MEPHEALENVCLFEQAWKSKSVRIMLFIYTIASLLQIINTFI